MCGICGVVSNNPLEEGGLVCVENMAGDLGHRGPDARGIWQNKRAALGHRRLAILDLSETGHQPMVCMNGRYVVVFNGEIYNFVELRRELSAKGYSFKTESDTEIIAASYDAWGKDCLNHFNGMWAFGLWNCQNESLVLARDRFGIKPLYFFYDGNILAFASEVKALHRWLGNSAKLDADVVSDICMGRFSSHGTEKTYLRDVRSLSAGYMACLRDGQLNIEHWYNLLPVDVPQTLPEQAEMFRDLFFDSCRLRLRSDVPVGTCLSGGLDSSSIVSVLHKCLGQTAGERATSDFHDAFCASFPKTVINEAQEAQTLAQGIDARLHVLDIIAPSSDDLEEAMRACDGPMHSLAFYPIWKLYGFINQHNIKVTLDGQGPDEMLGGYRPFLSAFRAALNGRDLSWAMDVYKTYGNQGRNEQFNAKMEVRSAFFYELRSRYLPNFLIRLAKSITGHKAGKMVDEVKLRFTNPTPNGLDEFQSELYNEFFQSPLPGILQQYDRCSMAHGIECRMPFMDYRLVEFMFSLPNTSRVGGGYTKRILREAMKGIVPETIRTRKTKIGFNAPIVDWFRGPLRGWIRDIMVSRQFSESPFFDGKGLVQEFEDFLKTNKPSWNLAWKFWGAVHFTWWQQNCKNIQEMYIA